MKEAEVRENNKIWATNERKLWETQAKTIEQSQEIERLNEGMCSLMEHNLHLERTKDNIYQIVYDVWGISLFDEDVSSASSSASSSSSSVTERMVNGSPN